MRTTTRSTKPTATQRAVIAVCTPGEWVALHVIADRLHDAGETVELDPREGPVLVTPNGESRRIYSILLKLKALGWARNRTTGDEKEWTVTPTAATL